MIDFTQRVRASAGMAAIAIAVITGISGCGRDAPPTAPVDETADADGFTPATAATRAAQQAVLDAWPDDPLEGPDFADRMQAARYGLIAEADDLRLTREDGRRIWDITAYDFIDGEAPATVHPGLWAQADLHSIAGLFKVTDGVYQLRGFDLANITLIDGDAGWIVIDPLTSSQTAAAAWEFAMKHLDNAPITAVIFTHSHIDHFGGIDGITDALADDAVLIAPKDFMAEATSENVLAGPAMQRRAGYMYGRELPRSPRGHVDTGLGKGPAFNGEVGIRAPTLTVDTTGQRETVDGVDMVFQYAPHTEAPAELTAYLPDTRVILGAEIASRTFHNIYTPRGAKVRDALRWAQGIETARVLFADAEIFAGSHHWPIRGQERVQRFLREQRDTYKYVHDQTLRLANNGYTPGEIAEQLQLPAALRRGFHNRDYYGTVRHNARAVYQWYFGWYDGNPANLNPLPPTDAGDRYVELAGGPQALLDSAQAAFDDGDYRWSAELLNHLVMSEQATDDGRALLAATYDQLGYQAESGPWRDIYLSAAQELRQGLPDAVMNLADTARLLADIPIPTLLDSMAARLDGPKAEDVALRLRLTLPDVDADHLLWIENAVLHHRPARDDDTVDARITISHPLFVRVLIREAKLGELLLGDELALEGSRLKVLKFFSLLDQPDGRFPIVTP